MEEEIAKPRGRGRPKTVSNQWKEELEKNPANLEYIAERSCVRDSSKDLVDVPDGQQYTAEQRLEAVTAYFITGSLRKAAEQVGIDERIVRKWKQVSPWWTKALAQVKRKKQEELDSKLTNLLEKSLEELRDRLLNGDEMINAKGKRIRKKVSAKDLGVISAILYDKRRDIRHDDVEEVSRTNDQVLADLKGKFEALSREINTKTIEGEVIKDERRADTKK